MKKNLLLNLLMLFSAASLLAQCPEITINEKYDHVPTGICIENGWDTVVNCKNGTLILNATPFITTQHFNGSYLIESIPYNPVDTSFHAGSHLNISTDDAWENSTISFPFTFMFFGYPYTSAVVGSNGLVSFNTSYVGQYCAYDYRSSFPIPSPNFPSLNAIYGVYEDIHPTSALTSTQGMFRSVGGTYPCRYLCASVNEVPLYPAGSHANDRCTYQIVCYEGTNIIEVHIKQRSCCSSTNDGYGLIGIQNATGTTQVSHYHDASYFGDPTFFIQSNAPGAFVAPGRGDETGWTGETSYEAWRFTPQGETTKNITWWRCFLDNNGNIIDSVQLTADAGDSNGFYLNPEHTRVSVTPTRTTKYVVQCRYQGANGYWYGIDNRSMRDTITIGLDVSNEMDLYCEDPILAEGEAASVQLVYPNEQTIDSCSWSAVKILNGERITLPSTALQSYFTSVVLRSQEGHLAENHIDSVWVYCTASFTNGCNKYDSLLILTYPNYHIYDTVGICRGESYSWCGYTFNQPQETFDTIRRYYSSHETDSIHYLHLIVSDLSYNTDVVLDCKPYTWINGQTYSEDNDATREQDTVHLVNEWGCDSIVTLDFTIIPMKAIISHTPEVATIDELSIELTDMSYGHDSRVWLLPNNETSTLPQTSIIFPLDGVDTMDVRLAVHNDYGCDDTALSRIPLIKVSNFIPNVFTPDLATNNRFKPAIQGNINDVRVYIYNRKGEQVCYFQGPDGYWDGTNMNGVRCPQGAYVYIIRYRTALNPGVTQELKGTITLIR